MMLHVYTCSNITVRGYVPFSYSCSLHYLCCLVDEGHICDAVKFIKSSNLRVSLEICSLSTRTHTHTHTHSHTHTNTLTHTLIHTHTRTTSHFYSTVPLCCWIGSILKHRWKCVILLPLSLLPSLTSNC